MPVQTTTYTCQVASTASLEHLLVATAAALADVDLTTTTAVGNAAETRRLVLNQVTKDAWSGLTTHSTSLGWLGASRALSGGGREARAESWLEATDLTLVTIAKQLEQQRQQQQGASISYELEECRPSYVSERVPSLTAV
jgi:hypothetical protein